MLSLMTKELTVLVSPETPFTIELKFGGISCQTGDRPSLNTRFGGRTGCAVRPLPEASHHVCATEGAVSFVWNYAHTSSTDA